MIVRVLQPRQLQQIVDHPLQMDAFGQHLLVVFIDFGGILDDMIVQGLQRAADDRDRRAQFMGNARDEILAHLIQLGAFLRSLSQLVRQDIDVGGKRTHFIILDDPRMGFVMVIRQLLCRFFHPLQRLDEPFRQQDRYPDRGDQSQSQADSQSRKSRPYGSLHVCDIVVQKDRSDNLPFCGEHRRTDRDGGILQ